MNTHSVPIGPKRRGKNATLCEVGFRKLQSFNATLGYKKAEGKATVMTSIGIHMTADIVKGKPYVFARFTDSTTEKEMRPALGRWLLGSTLPVAHLNGDPMDFRLENLRPQETERQRKRREEAEKKRAIREEKKARAAARRARRKLTPDGLTPEQQLTVALDPEFQQAITRVARAIVRDDMSDGTADNPTDYRRGDEVVSMVVDDSIKAILTGKVLNVRSYLWVAMLTQARKERTRKWRGMGHVRRPARESKTISESHLREQEQMEEEAA